MKYDLLVQPNIHQKYGLIVVVAYKFKGADISLYVSTSIIGPMILQFTNGKKRITNFFALIILTLIQHNLKLHFAKHYSK